MNRPSHSSFTVTAPPQSAPLTQGTSPFGALPCRPQRRIRLALRDPNRRTWPAPKCLLTGPWQTRNRNGSRSIELHWTKLQYSGVASRGSRISSTAPRKLSFPNSPKSCLPTSRCHRKLRCPRGFPGRFRYVGLPNRLQRLPARQRTALIQVRDREGGGQPKRTSFSCRTMPPSVSSRFCAYRAKSRY
jgi:hypothetical protein